MHFLYNKLLNFGFIFRILLEIKGVIEAFQTAGKFVFCMSDTPKFLKALLSSAMVGIIQGSIILSCSSYPEDL